MGVKINIWWLGGALLGWYLNYSTPPQLYNTDNLSDDLQFAYC